MSHGVNGRGRSGGKNEFRGLSGRGHRRGRGGSSYLRFEKGASVTEFPDYEGEKLHELPEEILQTGGDAEVGSTSFVEEKDVGIELYMNKEFQKGIQGIIKHRYSDFNVNEVDKDGNVVYLTDLQVPAVDKVKEIGLTDLNIPPYGTLDEEVKTWMSALNWAKLTKIGKKYAEDSQRPPDEDDKIKLDVSDKSKEERKRMHLFARRYFPHLLSQTEEEGERKFIVVSYKYQPKRGGNDWPRERQEQFLHFTLYKEDMDMNTVFGGLSKILRISGTPSYSFKFCGNKDKRGRTSQRVAIKFMMAKRLQRAVELLNKQNRSATAKAVVGNFCYKKISLELGELKGNRFTIAVRNIDGSENVDQVLSCVRDNGFINYFGLQRFGSVASVKTSDVGLALLKGEWVKAVEKVLRPRMKEKPWMARARNHWWMYRNASDALLLLGKGPETHSIEGCLLRGLAECDENDVIGALGYIQRTSRLIYIHAYQALIWNRVISKRITVFGKSVLVGDLVLLPEGQKGNFLEEEVDKEGLDSEEQERDEADAQDSKRRRKEKLLSFVKSESDAENFTIYDVVMPIPGHSVPYPKHAQLKQFYLDALSQDGLEDGFEAFKGHNPVYSVGGDYRHIVAKPVDLQWKTIKYSNPSKALFLSDLDVLNGLKAIESEEDGNFEALILEMTLRSSTYATMALREVTRFDTGKSQQSLLTSKHVGVKEHSCQNSLEESEENQNGAKRPKEVEEEEEEEKVQPKKLKPDD